MRLHARRRPMPREHFRRLVRSAAGGLVLRPWFDEAALRLLTQWYFPLSRGWAAALDADGSLERFEAALPCSRFARRLLPAILARAQVRRAAMEAADALWEQAFFGDGTDSADAATAGPRAHAEAVRMGTAARLTGLRTALVPLHMQSSLPPVDWEIEPVERVALRHGERLRHPEHAFADSFDPAAMQVSHCFPTPLGSESWVRCPAPAAAGGGPMWARVSTPAHAAGPASRPMPSLVFTHGIGMEPEYTGDGGNPLAALVAEGVRVIRPEGPWHGRRRISGRYGGEPVLSRGPGGLLDYFQAHVIELGRLVAWARATRGGPVCLGGVSLGALTAQLAAVAARDWPREMRPDALFLVAPSRSLVAVTFQGSLTRALGVPAAIRAGGWNLGDFDRWRPLLEPVEPPAVPAERIVVVIGRTDDVTLAAGGEALVQAWGLPEENVFRARAGHFSTSLGLARDAAPFRRLLRVLRETETARAAAGGFRLSSREIAL